MCPAKGMNGKTVISKARSGKIPDRAPFVRFRKKRDRQNETSVI